MTSIQIELSVLSKTLLTPAQIRSNARAQLRKILTRRMMPHVKFDSDEFDHEYFPRDETPHEYFVTVEIELPTN